MPKHKLIQDPIIANAIVEIVAYMEKHSHKQHHVVENTGISQPQVAKILGGRTKKVSPDFILLCQYAGVKLDSSPKSPHMHPRIQAAINKVWDGRDETIEIIAKLIECADIVHGRTKSDGREREAS